MKICIISDTHCRHPRLPSSDLLIHCGDLTKIGSRESFCEELYWLKVLRAQFPKGIVYVPGNHDKGLDGTFIAKCYKKWEEDPYHSYRPPWTRDGHLLIKETFKENGISILINSGVTIDGISFWGMPYTPPHMNWAFMAPELEIARYLKKVPQKTDILITHGPPKFILDLGYNGHLGSSALADFFAGEGHNIKLSAFGHIHKGAGLARYKRTAFINAAVLNEDHNKFNPVYIVDTDTWEVTAFKF